MAAIRWDNINNRAGDALAASAMLEHAQRSFNSAFDPINRVMAEQEKIGLDNWNQVGKNNDAAYMERLNSAKSPEELAAMQGELASMRSGFQAQSDRAKLMAATQAQPGILQQRATVSNAFEDSQRLRSEAPEVDRITQLALTDPAAAQAALADAPVKFKAALQKAIVDTKQQNVLQDRATTEFGWKGNAEQRAQSDQALQENLAPFQQKLLEAQAQHAKAQADEAIAESKASSGGSTKKIQAAIDTFKPVSHFSDGAVGTKEGDAAVENAIKQAAANPAEARDIRYNLQKYMAEKAKSGIQVPASAVIAAIGQATPNPIEAVIPGWSRRGDDMYDQLDTYLKKHEDTIIGDQNRLNSLRKQIVQKGEGSSDTSGLTPSVETPVRKETKVEKVVLPPPTPVVANAGASYSRNPAEIATLGEYFAKKAKERQGK